MSILVSESKKKNHPNKQAEEIYGFSLEKKSEENLEWMIRNGYIKKKRIRYNKPGRPHKIET